MISVGGPDRCATGVPQAQEVSGSTISHGKRRPERFFRGRTRRNELERIRPRIDRQLSFISTADTADVEFWPGH